MSFMKAKIDAHVNKVMRTVALDLDQRVVLKTPVDTGRARANWLVGLGAPRRESSVTLDKSGSKAIVDAANTIGRSRAYQSIWISNNLPYIDELERGSSRQAPAGMAALSVQEVARVHRGR